MRVASLGGVIGPAGFISAWIVGALVTAREYSSIDDPISRLAAVGTDSRPIMSAGFVVFGCGVTAFAAALRAVVPGPAWITAAVTAVATLGVAATPLDHSATVDSWHGVFAGIGYVSLALTPLLAARPLVRLGARRLATGGAVAATVSGVALALTLTGAPTGLVQRIGLTATDVWIVAVAVAIATKRLTAPPAASAPQR